MAVTLRQTEDRSVTPVVGERWRCDVTGRVSWADSSETVVETVTITWASNDGRVFEGSIRRNGKTYSKVPLYRGIMRERVA